MSHINLRNLTALYGNHKALQDISIDIPDGQITAIIGPSGCGKTTLLKSLNRLLELNEDVKIRGQVYVDGVNIYDPNADILELRKKIGFMSQRPYPLPMSIYDNVAFGPKIHGLSGHRFRDDIQKVNGRVIGEQAIGVKNGGPFDQLVEYYLRLAGLWDEVKERLNSPASKLSIGQQQRLALARALSVEPEVILADEATSALDPISAKLVETQFRILKKDYSIIMVTHILRQARRIADYVIFLYMGELVEHGPASVFFNAPNDEKTKAYISGEIS
jgi:phosphate transport system ATP-binding protein